MTTTEATTLVSKNRGGSEGPTHAWAVGLTWCGRRMRGLSWHRPGTPEDVTCPACKTALAQDHPRSYRRNR